MSKISKSPNRHTFQKEGYVNRMEEQGKPVNEDYLELFETIIEQHDTKFKDLQSRVNNMEYDLLTTDWILEKVRAKDSYAQNLYAAMCNMEWRSKALWPTLKEENWGCSWRYAGGIIADMQQKGDYMDWYCSGMGGFATYDLKEGEEHMAKMKYVPEGTVTDEIATDLDRLGWIPIPNKDNK
jgi:hypothetical protein